MIRAIIFGLLASAGAVASDATKPENKSPSAAPTHTPTPPTLLRGANVDSAQVLRTDAFGGFFSCPPNPSMKCIPDESCKKIASLPTHCTFEADIPTEWSFYPPVSSNTPHSPVPSMKHGMRGLYPAALPGSSNLSPAFNGGCSILTAGNYSLVNPKPIYEPEHKSTGEEKISWCLYIFPQTPLGFGMVTLASESDTWRPKWYPRSKSGWPLPDGPIENSTALICDSNKGGCAFKLPPLPPSTGSP